MNLTTIKLLSEYDSDTKIIDMSNKNINGILNLKNFKELEKLYCSHNQITEIIEIPKSLKYLNCSHNKITTLLRLPDNPSSQINYKSNPLIKLYYPFDVKPRKYPKNLTHLTFYCLFNQSIDNLPNSIRNLELSYSFNQFINRFPKNLTHLIFVNSFNKPVNNLPNTINHLTFVKSFSKEIICVAHL